MKPILALQSYMKEHFPRTLRDEVLCTCGAGNHVRLLFFRVDGQPVTVVISEGVELSTAQLADAIGSSRVQLLQEPELDAIYPDSELGHMQPFENPFGSAVYCDESLLTWKELVFCPRMFSGQRGECFRATTKDFLALTRAIVLPLSGTPVQERDLWAV
ncbi:MAG: YbaK/EbsC family protein [Acidobacteria bacterium]|nr:YbaK/EbsC family protein [Acidobacteriota bacterium]